MTQSPRKRKLLVTGASGFVGAHVEAAVARGVFGPTEFVPAPRGWDLRDPSAVNALVAEVQPFAVMHLAAQSHVPRSFEDPVETLAINMIGTSNLLVGLASIGFSGRLVYVSSGDIYGIVSEDKLPVDERHAPAPRNPYAVSKWSAEQLCLMWHRTHGLDVCIARPFNHVGPGQDARFVLPALARQLVAISSDEAAAKVEVGDIDVTRDFTDVRDVVAAYAAILEHGETGATYVIGTGRERSVRELLRMMCAIEHVSPIIEQSAGRLRPAEQRRMSANSSRLTMRTGWLPTIPMEQTLRDILEDARSFHD